ncbi:MAG: ribonuclease HI [Bacillota bacterium]
MKSVVIYTDGACSGNPGAGGYGVVMLYKEMRKELSAGYELTTNNRMEMMAVIEGLKALKAPCHVDLYSDSKYVIDSIEKEWVYKWRKQGWKKSDKSQALNVDLWILLLELLEYHEVKFHWVKGHANIPENERCDELAREAIGEIPLLVDSGYQS